MPKPPANLNIPFTTLEKHFQFPYDDYGIITVHPAEAVVMEKLGVHCRYLRPTQEVELLVDQKNVKLPLPDIALANTPSTFNLYIPLEFIPILDKNGNCDFDYYAMRVIQHLNPLPTHSNGKWVRNWFSNRVPLSVHIQDQFGIYYDTVENYYQASRTLDSDLRADLSKMQPLSAKKFWSQAANALYSRPDWEEVKHKAMWTGLWHKYTECIEHRPQLEQTGIFPIIEFNNWQDKYWGISVYDCLGKNTLGKMLMAIRHKLFNQSIPF